MAVKASANITIFHVIDIDSTTIYYLLQSSTANPPAKPTTDNPGGNWTTTEPTYTEGNTNTLYTVTKTKFSDGTFEYTPVSKSTAYEAAKTAYNKAVNANNNANTASSNATSALNKVNNLQVGGINIIENSSLTKNLDKMGGTSSLNNFTYEFTTKNGYDCLHIHSDNFQKTCYLTQSIRDKLGLYENNYPDREYTVSCYILIENFVKGTTNNYCTFSYLDGSKYNDAEKSTSSWGGSNGVTSGSYPSGYPGTLSPTANGKGWIKYYYTFKFTNEYGYAAMSAYPFYLRDFKGDVYIRNFKLELGNKPTDWSPAPEDVAADIKDVNDTVDETNQNVANLGNRTDALETDIGNKVDNSDFSDYKTYVVNTYATIKETNNKISISINEATKTLVTKSEYSSTTSSLAEVRSYFDFASDGLTIGKSTSNTTLVLTNDKLAFKLNGVEKAYMSPDSFVLKQLKTFKLGGFAFKVRANGNLALVWVGEEE